MTRVKVSYGKQCVRFYKFKFCNLSEKFKLAQNYSSNENRKQKSWCKHPNNTPYTLTSNVRGRIKDFWKGGVGVRFADSISLFLKYPMKMI